MKAILRYCSIKTKQKEQTPTFYYTVKFYKVTEAAKIKPYNSCRRNNA